MGVNFILLCFGLLICFGGIYFKRVCSAILGLIWGGLLGFVICIMFMDFWYSDSGEMFLVIMISALIVAALSAFFDRLCTAINTFLACFLTAMLLLMLGAASDFGIFIAFIIALAMAVVAYIYYKNIFIIITAFSGAFIAGIGGTGLSGGQSISERISSMMWGDDGGFSVVFFCTIVLGVVGVIVQRRRINGVVNSTMQGASNTIKNFGENISPVIGELSNKAKETWKETYTSDVKQELKEAIFEEKWLFIAPILAYLIIPFIFRNFYDMPEIFYTMLYWIKEFTIGVSLGTLVYFTLKKDVKLNLIYQIPYFLGYIAGGYFSFEYMFSAGVIGLFFHLLLYLILSLTARVLKNQELQPVALSAVLIVCSTYVLPWIQWRYISFVITRYEVFQWIIIVAAVFVLYFKKLNVNIFSFVRK